MADESTPVTSPGDPATPPASPKLGAIEAQLGNPESATAEGQEVQVPKQGDQALSGDVTVDWGGTRRTVPIETLVEAAQRSEEIEAKAKLVNDQLTEMGTLSALGQVIEGMDDAQRSQLKVFLNDPSLLTQMANGHEERQRPEDDLDDEISNALRGRRSAPPQDDRVAQLEQTVNELREFAQASLAERQSQGLAQKVADSMKTFPVFEEHPDALRMTMKSIINEHTLNPQTSVDSIVASHAADLHKLVLASRQGVVVEQTGGAPSPIPTPVNAEGWKPKGDDLMNKTILRKTLKDMGFQ